jgi:hypothetical protein
VASNATVAAPEVKERPLASALTTTFRSRDVGPLGTLGLIAVFAIASALALYMIWVFWPSEARTGTLVARQKPIDFLGIHRTVARESLFFVTVAVCGALGGMVHVLRSIAWYTGNRLLKWQWVPFYLLRPVLGATMATLLYFIVRAGFFSPSASTREASPYGFAALAALAGLFSDHAAEKLKKVASELFEEPPHGKDTVAAEPEVEAGPARDRSGDEAVLVGTVNPKGSETSYRFEWGETTDYGSWSPQEPMSVGSGLAPMPVSVRLTGLDPAGEYHYRLVAISDGGIAVSGDQVLRPIE